VVRKLSHDLFRVCLWLVHLVDSHDDGNFRRLGVVDGFDGLRLHAIIRSNDENDDIGDLCSAGSHGGKRLVTRRIQEDKLTLRVIDEVSTNMLGDPACLTRSHIRFPDSVQKGCFSVVDMSHDRDDRRPAGEVLHLLGIFLEEIVYGVGYDLYLESKFADYKSSCLWIKSLVDSGHDPQLEKYLDDLGSLGTGQPGKTAYSKSGSDANGLLDRHRAFHRCIDVDVHIHPVPFPRLFPPSPHRLFFPANRLGS